MTLLDEDAAPPAANGDVTYEVDEDDDQDLALEQNNSEVEVLFEESVAEPGVELVQLILFQMVIKGMCMHMLRVYIIF